MPPFFMCAMMPARFLSPQSSMDYDAILSLPFGAVGVRCDEVGLTGIDFLPDQPLVRPPAHSCAHRAVAALSDYLTDSRYEFDLPLRLVGTPYQRRVWQALCEIPPGEMRTYGEIAAQLGSSARAVGQACGRNPIPIVIPCHRVVGKNGLGGFMLQASDESLRIKRWLLRHEGASIED